MTLPVRSQAAAAVSPITIAKLLGHSSTQIVPRYAQVLDQNRRDVMKKLEALRRSSLSDVATAESIPTTEASDMVRH